LSKLTPKQEIFIAEYVACWNASEAARRAGYNGQSNSVGSQLLANISIAAEIERRKALIVMSAEEVAVRLTEQGRASYAQYLTTDGVDLDRLLADGKGYLIKKIKPTKEGLEIEFYDAQAALALMAKINGQLRDRTEVSGPGGGPVELVVKYVDKRDD
jgi:phage terminase small subunit